MTATPGSPVALEVTRLFVYGTLMRGERADEMLAGCPFLGPACTEPAYVLVSLGAYPALVRAGDGGRGPGVAVAGEVYAVDATTLRELDDYEDHPTMYRRGPLTLAGGEVVEAYVLPAALAPGAPSIPSGDWRRRG